MLTTKTEASLKRSVETVCPTCKGDKTVFHVDGLYKRFIDQGMFNDAQVESLKHPCPDCAGTGWKHPELRRPCGHVDTAPGWVDYTRCPGRLKGECWGYVLLPEAELAGVLMEMLIAKTKCGIMIQPIEERGYGISLSIGANFWAEGPTLVDALAAAVEKLENA